MIVNFISFDYALGDFFSLELQVIYNINFNTDKSIEDLVEKILAELEKVGALNL